jgi:hypothetical protein
MSGSAQATVTTRADDLVQFVRMKGGGPRPDAMQSKTQKDGQARDPDTAPAGGEPRRRPQSPKEIDGPRGPEPTRYGDWERRGRCIDF